MTEENYQILDGSGAMESDEKLGNIWAGNGGLLEVKTVKK